MSFGAFAGRFADWAKQVVVVEPFIGTDDYGEPEYGSGISMDCSLQAKIRPVSSAIGEERISNSTLYVLGGPIDPRDRFTMPGVFKGALQPKIINVANWYDTDGSFSHSEVYL